MLRGFQSIALMIGSVGMQRMCTRLREIIRCITPVLSRLLEFSCTDLMLLTPTAIQQAYNSSLGTVSYKGNVRNDGVC